MIASRPAPGDGWSGQRWVQLAGYSFIAGLAIFVLRPFLVPIAWAAILAYTSWPAFQWLERLLRGRSTVAASLMTLGIVLVVMVPAAIISVALAAEVHGTYAWLRRSLPSGPAAALAWVREIPRIGPYLAERASGVLADPAGVQDWILGRLGGWAGTVGSLAAGIGRGLFEAVLILITLFLLYRHGQNLLVRIRRAVERLGGPRMTAMLDPLGETIRAVTYGTLLTALAQGTLVMVGCWAVGLGAPVLLGALTGLLGLTPLGPPIIYLPASAWLMVEGRYAAGVFLLVWGLLVVSSVDNVIRSWFLAGAARVPFFLGLLGLLGGVAAFGALGLFVGPVSVALMLTVWREWTDEEPPAAGRAVGP